MTNLLVKCDGDGLQFLWNREEMERTTNRDGFGGVIGGEFDAILGSYGLLNAATVVAIGCAEIVLQ